MTKEKKQNCTRAKEKKIKESTRVFAKDKKQK
jgi:hypothetical protein